MKKIFTILLLLACININAQKWGLYTLYSVQGNNNVYLVDTNNTIYKTWTFPTNSKTGFSVYLTPGDTLVRTISYQGAVLHDGPTTGKVQKADWNGNITWDFVYSDSTNIIHHDICPMPNGNVLMIAMEVKTAAQVAQAGSSANQAENVDKILEVHPTGPTSGTIVWEWHLWDHVCQNYNASKDNYVSSIVNNPQLLNINYNTSRDFCHMNGIDYNAALDQITFSSFTFSEVFVIDHSTTTAEAAGHTGGNSGHGGDIIYRWGNPASYEATGTAFLNVVHDAHWISADNPYFPNYLGAFNNKGGFGGRSAVDVFSPPYNGYNYNLTLGSAYGPTNYSWLYTADTSSTNEGSTQQLNNGNSLVCLSFADSIIEVNQSGNIIWRFNPGGQVAKAYRYSKCYVRGPIATASASSTQISMGTPITLNSSATSVTETNPTYTYSWTSIPVGFSSSVQNPSLSPSSTATYIVKITNTALGCSDTASVSVNVNINGINDRDNSKEVIVVYPNPTNGKLNLSGLFKGDNDLQLICSNAEGKIIMNFTNISTIDFSAFPDGVYYLTVKSGNSKIKDFKVIKSK
ncbi:MAG: aryl-sulfate sulfotransferase [Bacteroidota bacterium]